MPYLCSGFVCQAADEAADPGSATAGFLCPSFRIKTANAPEDVSVCGGSVWIRKLHAVFLGEKKGFTCFSASASIQI